MGRPEEGDAQGLADYPARFRRRRANPVSEQDSWDLKDIASRAATTWDVVSMVARWHLVNHPQKVVVLNVLFDGEGSHAPVFGEQGVPLVICQSQGKAVHEAEGASPALIGDRSRHAFGLQGFDAKAKSDEVLSVIAAQVDDLLVEQQVRHGEPKAQLEHPVQHVPLAELDQYGTVADEDLHDVSVCLSHHDTLDFADPHTQEFGGFGSRYRVLRQRSQAEAPEPFGAFLLRQRTGFMCPPGSPGAAEYARYCCFADDAQVTHTDHQGCGADAEYLLDLDQITEAKVETPAAHSPGQVPSKVPQRCQRVEAAILTCGLEMTVVKREIIWLLPLPIVG